MKCKCFAQFPGPQRLGNSLYTITVLHDPCEARAFQGEKCVRTWAKCRFFPPMTIFQWENGRIEAFLNCYVYTVCMIDVLGSIAVQSLLWDKSVIKSDLCLRNALKTPFSSSQNLEDVEVASWTKYCAHCRFTRSKFVFHVCCSVFFNFAIFCLPLTKPSEMDGHGVQSALLAVKRCYVYCTNYCEMPFTSLYVYACIYLPHYNYDYDIWYIYTRIYIYNYIIIYLYQLYTSSANEEQEITKDNTGSINALL